MQIDAVKTKMESSLKSLWQFYKETALTIFVPGRAAEKRDALYSNSIFLIANAGAGAALGFGFWVLAAKLYPAEAVGLGSALLSAGGLLVFVATLGLGQGLIRYLPSLRSNAAALINSCFTLSSIVAAIAALVFIAGIPLWSPALGFVRSDIRFGITFVIFIISNTIFSLFNDTYLALRHAEYSFIQGTLMGLLKLALVAVLAGLFGLFGIMASWMVATAVLVLLGLFVFLVRLQPGYRPLPVLPQPADKEMIRFSFSNYLSLGLWSLPGWILPVMVLNQAGSQANAYFYMGWAFAGLLFAIPLATANSLFAEGSRQDSNLAGNIKRSLKLIGVLALPVAVVLAAAGDKLLLAFGKQYSEEATKLLWLLVPAIIPLSINVVYIAAAKVRKSMGQVLGITAAITVITLILAFILLPRMGILGAGTAFLAAQTIVALAILPGFTGLLREKNSPGDAP